MLAPDEFAFVEEPQMTRETRDAWQAYLSAYSLVVQLDRLLSSAQAGQEATHY
jgi:hypothetical protein